ncbi:GAF domain-containing protein [Streptomyces sp. VRA16 Mangrove soil]|uniref:GAF domain-containing protein n=1 Tax=Streptomyces sp. VRA16 Mangrove soil TaxID=2817434 RepID=UPI001A9E7C59|nr:GAF domain-containing protein [Streptomyces sp. VRA16 Mangrove soil]MBO1335272.1 GAF domain-containing protein [Streptomyces sp. VRA16 Mangrove soil]
MSVPCEILKGVRVVWSPSLHTVRVSVCHAPGRTTVEVAGELDVASLPALTGLLLPSEHPPGTWIGLDLSRVTFCAPGVVDELLRAAARLRTADCTLAIEQAHSSVRRVMRLRGRTGEFASAPAARMRRPAPDARDPYISLLAQTLTLALRITGAPMGNAQLYDSEEGVLRIVTQHGFHRPFLDYFETVRDRGTACGVAALEASPVFIEEVAASPVFLGTPAEDAMLDAEARAVASMPVLARDGALVGIVSVHRRRPVAWTREEQGVLGRLAHAAGQTLLHADV